MGLVRSFDGPAWSTGPCGVRLSADTLVTTDSNRWSELGEPTLYLAGDLGVVHAEHGRHWKEPVQPVCIWRLRVSLTDVIDIRSTEVRERLGLPDDPAWILDRDRSRAVARALRRLGSVEALLVPSAAFVDRPEHGNLVVFADRLRRSLTAAVAVASCVASVTASSPRGPLGD